MTQRIVAIVFCLAALWACKKSEPELSRFEVHTSQSVTATTFTWERPTFSDFKNITVYRSTAPIPDPSFGKAIDPALTLAVISDKLITAFIDSTAAMNEEGLVYYKFVLHFGDRFLVSELLTISLKGFSMILNSGSFSNGFVVVPFPPRHKIYYTNTSTGTARVIDYAARTISASVPNNSSAVLQPFLNQGNLEVFSANNNTIICYDGEDLSFKYSMTMPNTILSYTVKDNFLYIVLYGPTLQTYDLATKALVSTHNMPSTYYAYSIRLYNGSGNKIYMRYQNNYYNSSYGNYVYVNAVTEWLLNSGIPANNGRLNIPAIASDSLLSNSNYQNINVSPDGLYVTCNSSGGIYSIAGNSMHSIATGINPFPKASYSYDGLFVVSRPLNNTNLYKVEVFELPGFTNKVIMTSPNNPSNFTNSINDFTWQDTLVSYNIVNQFSTGSTAETVLTMYFNKIN